MIRKFKALTVALVAVCAVTGVVTQTAAATETYTSGAEAEKTTFITGEKTSNHVFSTPNGSVSCSSITFKGEAVQTGPSAHEITINPTYSECTAFGFAKAHVTNNNCHYLFTTPTTISATEWTIHPPHIVSTSGSSCNFTITPTSFGVSVCTQTVPNQTPTSGHIIATNGVNDVNLVTTVEGIHYTGTGGVCGNGETHSDATYTGNVTVKGYSNAAHTTQVAVSLG